MTVESISKRSEARPADDAPEVSRAQVNPVLVLSGLLALVFTLMALVLDDGANALPDAPPRAPELFDRRARCTQPAESARHHGISLEMRALAKSERAPFRAQDGVEAALCLAEARACYLLGGDPKDAERLRPVLRRWQQKIRADYQRNQLQLEFALRELNDALSEQGSVPPTLATELKTLIEQLKALLVHREGPYRDWLESLARRFTQEETKS